jgi:hypothetical protein
MAPGAGAGDSVVTTAEAFVDRDFDRDFEYAFDIEDLDSPVVDPENLAVAHARRCTGCKAVGLSFQIVLLQQPATTVAAENLAVAVNEECTSCDAAAGAYQFIVGRGEPIRLTQAGYEQLADVRKRVALLEASTLTGPEMVARADQLADEVRAILSKEVRPLSEDYGAVIDDRRFRSFGDGTSQESSTTMTAG